MSIYELPSTGVIRMTVGNTEPQERVRTVEKGIVSTPAPDSLEALQLKKIELLRLVRGTPPPPIQVREALKMELLNVDYKIAELETIKIKGQMARLDQQITEATKQIPALVAAEQHASELADAAQRALEDAYYALDLARGKAQSARQAKSQLQIRLDELSMPTLEEYKSRVQSGN